jgi:hypothetical protein
MSISLIIYVMLLMCHHASHAFSTRGFAASAAIRPSRWTSKANFIKMNTEAAAVPTDDERVKKRNKSSTTKWIACSSTKEMSRAITEYIKEGDVVAELGSQLRDVSISLCEAVGASGYAVLVDIERKSPNEKKGQDRTSAMRRIGDETDFYTDRATFIETKDFEFWRHALFFQNNVHYGKEGYNALVIDMSNVAGNDLELTCISMVKEFISLNAGSGEDDNPCRVVILKSKSLHNLARRLHHAQRIISGSQYIIEERGTSIIAAVGVDQYRQTIPFVVRKGDVCCEVGCHLGTSTVLINEAACSGGASAEQAATASGGCVGLDIGSSIIRFAQKKYPLLSFEVGNGFKTGEIARLTGKHLRRKDSSRILDVVYVDIGGLSGPEGLLESVSLLSSITNALEPRCIVIKSLCVRRLASCIVPFSDVWREIKSLEIQ